ncbi:hypothetical protein Tco_0839751 [Tanacetum coccineum]|uniref:Reverse transcriptase domain-containing protein n=1 Tax=Tanacetum coccineum TaxID=301880 RepID=A0ABQ5AWI2_9ASTR
MLSSFFQAQASPSGTLPSNTIPNPKGEMKAITTQGVYLQREPVESNTLLPGKRIAQAMLLKKLPEKLGDPGKFLIPCEFPGMEICSPWPLLMASIKLMPLFEFGLKNLSLPEDLSPTRITLIVDFEADPRVPLILGRSFLKTGRTLIDVYKGEITLRVDNEPVTFNLDQTMKYSSTNDKSVNRIDIIDEICEEYVLELLGFPSDDFSSGNPTSTSEPFTSEFTLEEINAFLYDKSISLESNHDDCDPEEDIYVLEQLLNDDPFQLPLIDLKQSEVTEAKSSIEEPPELELKDLPS